MANTRRTARRAAREAGAAPALYVAGLRRRDLRSLLGTTALQGAVLLVLAARAAAQPAPNAAPQGGQVVAGHAQVSQTSSTTTITQSSQRAAVNWTNFDVGSQQSVTFQQPASTSVTLNRVTGPNPSQIAGHITANGQVVLTNQSGVVFTRGAQVDVAGLVVSAAGITNQNFMAGNMKFDIPAHPNARIENAGTITLRQGGLAALVAPQVSNTGLITAKLGHVVLAGAATEIVDLYGDGLLSLDVTNQVATVPVGPDGKPVQVLVTNTGAIAADGGTVQLTARAVDGLVQNLVTAGGRISANSVGARLGTVVVNGIGGSVRVVGDVSAAGLTAGTAGGNIELNASDTVKVTSGARLNASGNAGGGTVAVGTTLARAKGGSSVIPKMTAQTTSIEAGARITADATQNGNGGHVTVLSTQSTSHAGTISARGGTLGGNGGTIELSGSLGFSITGTIDVSAAKGALGTILIDPTDLTVADVSPTAVPSSTPPVNFGDAPAEAFVSIQTINGFAGDVVLQATNNINVIFTAASIPGGDPNPNPNIISPVGALTIQAGNDVSVDKGITINLGTADLTLAGGVSFPTPPVGSTGAVILGSTIGTGATGLVTINANTAVGSTNTVLLQSAGSGGISLGNDAVIGIAGAPVTTLSLSSNAGVTQTSGGSASLVVTNLITGSVVTGDVSLLGTANAITNLGPFQTTGNFTLVNTPSTNQPLTITGAVTAGTVSAAAPNPANVQTISITTPTDLVVNNTLNAGTVSLVVSGAISQANTAAVIANTLTGPNASATFHTATQAALGSTQNSIGTLGAFSTSGNFSLVNDQGLTVLGPLTAGLNAAPSPLNAQSITLTVPGALTITGAVNAGTVNLLATGVITESGAGVLQANTLNGPTAASPAASATLNNSANAITNLGSFSTTGDFTLANSGALAILGTISTGGTLALNAIGAITEPTGVILATTLSGPTTASPAASATLSATANTIANLGSFSTTGDFTLANTGALAVIGTVSAGGTLALNATGAITEPTGVILATTLSGPTTASPAASATLNATANTIANLGSFSTTGDFTLANTGALAVIGTVSAGGTLALNATGAITEPTGVILATTLSGPTTASPAASATLNATANSIANLGSFSTTGDFTLANTGALAVIGTVSAGGTLALNATGAITEPTGVIRATTLSGPTTASPAASATLNATANSIANLGSFSTTGDFTLANTGALAVIGTVSAGGTLALNATGAITEPTGVILATTLSGPTTASPAASATLNATANSIANLGSFSTTGDFTLANTGALAVIGTVSAGGTLALNATGAITEPTGVILATTLSGPTTTPAASATLNHAGNSITNLGSFSTAGDFILVDTGTLSVIGLVTAGDGITARNATLALTAPGLTVANTGALTAATAVAGAGTIFPALISLTTDSIGLSGLVTAKDGTVAITRLDAGTLATGGTISLDAVRLPGSLSLSLTPADLANIKTIGTLSSGQLGTQSLVLGSADGSTASATVNAVAINTGINLTGVATTLSLFSNAGAIPAGGSISEAAAGAITVHDLTALAGGSINLVGAANAIAQFGNIASPSTVVSTQAVPFGDIQAGGSIVAADATSLTILTNVKAPGTIQITTNPGSLTVQTGNGGTNIGLIQGSTVTLAATGDFLQSASGSTISSTAGTVAVSATGGISQTVGTIAATTDADLSAGTSIFQAGLIRAGSNANLSAGTTIAQSGGTITAGTLATGDVTLSAVTLITQTSNSTIQSLDHNVSLSAGSGGIQFAGTIAAPGTISLGAVGSIAETFVLATPTGILLANELVGDTTGTAAAATLNNATYHGGNSITNLGSFSTTGNFTLQDQHALAVIGTLTAGAAVGGGGTLTPGFTLTIGTVPQTLAGTSPTDLIISAPVSAPTVSLTASGSISQTGGTITGTDSGSSVGLVAAGGAILQSSGAEIIATNAAGSIALTAQTSLALGGTVSATGSGASIGLIAQAGSITETNGADTGIIDATLLTGAAQGTPTVLGNVKLDNTTAGGNSITNLGTFSATGDFVLVDTGTLSVVGRVTAGDGTSARDANLALTAPGLTVANTGALTAATAVAGAGTIFPALIVLTTDSIGLNGLVTAKDGTVAITRLDAGTLTTGGTISLDAVRLPGSLALSLTPADLANISTIGTLSPGQLGTQSLVLGSADGSTASATVNAVAINTAVTLTGVATTLSLFSNAGTIAAGNISETTAAGVTVHDLTALAGGSINLVGTSNTIAQFGNIASPPTVVTTQAVPIGDILAGGSIVAADATSLTILTNVKAPGTIQITTNPGSLTVETANSGAAIGLIQGSSLTLVETGGDFRQIGAGSTISSTLGTIAVSATGSIAQISGTIAAATNATLSAGTSITQTGGVISAGGTALLIAVDDITQNSGSITALGNATLEAQTGSVIQLSSGISPIIQSTTGSVVVSALQNITQSAGTIVAHFDTDLTAGGSIFQAGLVSAGSNANLSAGTDISQVGGIVAGGTAFLVAVDTITQNSGSVTALGNATLAAQTGSVIQLSSGISPIIQSTTESVVVSALQNITQSAGTIVAHSDTDLTAGASIFQAGLVSAGNNATLSAGTSISQTGGVIVAGGTAFLVAHDDITQTNGSITALGNATLAAQTGSVIQLSSGISPIIQSTSGSVVVSALQNITQSAGTIFAHIDADLTAGASILQAGLVSAFQGNDTLSAGVDIIQNGAVLAGGSVFLSAGHNIVQNQANLVGSGLIRAGANATLTAAGSIVQDGSVFAGGNVLLTAAQNLYQNQPSIVGLGTISAGSNATLGAGIDIVQNGSILAGINAYLSAGQIIFQNQFGPINPNGVSLGIILAGHDATLSAGAIDQNGIVSAGYDAILRATGDILQGHLVSAVRNATLNAGHNISQYGAVYARGGATLTAGNDLVQYKGAVVSATANATLGAGVDITQGASITPVVFPSQTYPAKLVAGANAYLTAGHNVAQYGVVTAGGKAVVSAANGIQQGTTLGAGGSVVQAGGTIAATASYVLLSAGGSITQTDSSIIRSIDRNVTLTAAAGSIAFGGTIATPGTIALFTGATNGGGITETFAAAPTGVLLASELVGNAGGTLSSATLNTPSTTAGNTIVNLGSFTTTGNFTLVNQGSLAVVGTIAAGGSLAPNVANSSTLALTVAGDLAIGTTGTLGQPGSLNGGTVALIATGGNIIEANGPISANLLTGSAGKSATLTNTSNSITSLGSFSAAGSIVLQDATSLSVNGVVTASTIGLTTQGALLQGGGTIDATGTGAGPSLALTAAGGALSQAGGAVITATDPAAAIVLTASGSIALGGTITATGTAASLALFAQGAGITEPGSGILDVTTLNGSSATTVALADTAAGGNQIANLGSFTTSAGSFTLIDGIGLAITGPNAAPAVTLTTTAGSITQNTGVVLTSPGAVALTAAGSIAIGGTISATGTAGSLALIAQGGAISETNPGDTGIIATTLLTGSATGNVTLDNTTGAGNQIATLGSFTTPGNFTLLDGETLQINGPLSVGGVQTIRADVGNLILNLTDTAPQIQFTAAGSIDQIGGALTATGAGAPSLTLTALGGSFLQSSGAALAASNASGTIVLTAAGSIALAGAVSATGPGGNVALFAQGGGITETNPLDTGSIAATTLTGAAATTVLLDNTAGAANRIANLGSFTAGAAFTLLDASGLTIGGPVSTGAQVIITGANLIVTGQDSAPTIALTAAGAISQSGGTVTGSGAGPVTLTANGAGISQSGGAVIAVTNAAGSVTLLANNAGSIALGGTISATGSGASVTLSSVGGSITETFGGAAGVIATTLLQGPTTGTAPVAVTLNDGSFNRIGTLGSFATNGAFVLADATSLTIAGIDTAVTMALTSTGGAIIESGGSAISVTGSGSVAAPSLALTADGGGISQAVGATITASNAAGAIALQSPSGTISLGGSIAATGTSAVLSFTVGSGDVTETNQAATTGSIAATLLTGSVGGAVVLADTAGNQIANLGAFTAGSSFLLQDTPALTVVGAVTAPIVTLTSQNAITQSTGSTITGTGATGAVSLTAGSSIALGGTIAATGTAATLALVALGGGISEPGSGILDVTTLNGSSATTVALADTAAGGNQIANLGSFTTSAGSFTLIDGIGLAITGPNAAPAVTLTTTAGSITQTTGVVLTSPGAVVLTAAGSIAIGGTISATGTAGSLALIAQGGAISETNPGDTGIIATTLLTGSATGNVTLDDTTGAGNQIATLGSFTTPGNFTLLDGETLQINGPLSVGGVQTIRADVGNLILNLTDTAPQIQFTAAGSIQQIGGALTATGAGAPSLTLTALGGSFLQSSGASLTASSSVGTVVLTAAGSIALGGAVSATGSDGSVALFAQGGGITETNPLDTGTIAASTLTGAAATTVLLDNTAGAANQIANLGSFTAGSSFTLIDAPAIQITGPNTATSFALTSTTGSITEAASTSITASAAGTASTPSIALTAASGGITQLIGATIVASNSAGSIALTSTSGPIVLAGTVGATGTAASLFFGTGTGDVTETYAGAARGIVDATLLNGNVQGSVGLSTVTGSGNQIGNLGSFTTAGTFTLQDAPSLVVTGPNTATAFALTSNGGAISETSGGSLLASGPAGAAPSIALIAYDGGITQASGGAIKATNPAGSIALTSAVGSIVVGGTVSAAGTDASLTLFTGTGDVTETYQGAKTGVVAATFLAGTVGGSVSLDATAGSGNTIGNIGALSVTGSLTLANATPVTITGPLAVGGAEAIATGPATATAGTFLINGSDTASSIVIVAGEPIALATGGAIIATDPAGTINLTAAGSISLGGSLSATGAAGGLTLVANGGDVTQTAAGALAGSIDATNLAANGTGAVTLNSTQNGGNLIGTVGSITTGAGFTLVNQQNLLIAGPLNIAGASNITVDAGAGTAGNATVTGAITAATIDLTAAGAISQTAGAMTATAAGSASTPSLVLAALGGSITTASGTALSATSSQGTVGLSAPGSLSLGGTINATGATAEVALTATGGSISETASGLVNTTLLTGSAGGSVALNDASGSANQVASLASFTTGAAFSLVNGEGLLLAGPLSAGGTASLTTLAGGPLTLDAPITAGNLSLTAAGALTQAAAAPILVNLPAGAATLTAGGDITLATAVTAPSLSITSSAGQIVQTGGAVTAQTGPATLNANANITLTGVVSAPTLSITSSAGQIAQTGGAITAQTGPATLNAGSNITLAGVVTAPTLSITSSAGQIVQTSGALTAQTGAATLMAASNVDLFGILTAPIFTVTASGGQIIEEPSSTMTALAGAATLVAGTNVNLSGALTAPTLSITAAGGQIVQQASSTVTAQGGPATLTANAGGITINGNLQDTAPNAAVSLSAGAVTINGNLAGSGPNAAVSVNAGSVTVNGNLSSTNSATFMTPASSGSVTFAGTLSAPLIDVASSQSVTLDGGTIFTGLSPRSGAQVQANFPTGTSGAFFTTTDFTQVGTTAIFSALSPTANSTVVIDISAAGAGGAIQLNNLSAPATQLFLTLGGGHSGGDILVQDLYISYTGTTGDSTLIGEVGGVGGQSAAANAHITSGTVSSARSSQYRVNNCAVGSVNCVVVTPQAIPVDNPIEDILIGNTQQQNDDPDLILPNVAETDY